MRFEFVVLFLWGLCFTAVTSQYTADTTAEPSNKYTTEPSTTAGPDNADHLRDALPLTFGNITDLWLLEDSYRYRDNSDYVIMQIGSVVAGLRNVVVAICGGELSLLHEEQLCRMADFKRAVLSQEYYKAEYRAPIAMFAGKTPTPTVSITCPHPFAPLEDCAIDYDETCTPDETLVLGCTNRPDKWEVTGVRLLSNSKVEPYLQGGRAEGLVVFDMKLNKLTAPGAPRTVKVRAMSGTIIATEDLLANQEILKKICRMAGYNKINRGTSAEIEDVIGLNMGNVTNPMSVLSPSGIVELGFGGPPLIKDIVFPRGSDLLIPMIDPCQFPRGFNKYTDGFEKFIYDKEEFECPENEWDPANTPVERALWISCKI